MKAWVVLWLFLGPLSHVSHAARSLPGTPAAAAEVISELHSPSDPYSFQYRFSADSKKYAGQLIDAQRFRHPVILAEDSGWIEFANYLHEGKYWIARLNKSARVAAGYAHIVNFSAVPGVTAAHTQYRVKFQPGSEIQLRSQVSGENETALVNDIVISSEAARPLNVPYDFAEGLFDNYAAMKRALSGKQRAEESLETPTEQLELGLSPAGLVQMVVNSIHEGSEEKALRFYGTLFPNCTTDLFHSIDRILALNGKKPEPFLTVLSPDPISTPTKKALEERGILGARTANLEREIFHGETEYVPSAREEEKSLGLFPERLADRLSVVLYIPGEQRLSPEERAVLESAKKRLYVLLSEVIQTSISTVSLDQARAQNVFQTGLLRLREVLKNFVNELDEQLPQGFDRKALVYFVPFVGRDSDEITDELLGDLPARLPFKTYRAQVNEKMDDLFQVRLAPRKVRSAFYEESERKDLPLKAFHFTGLALQLHLKKSQSSGRVQILGGLNPLESVLQKDEGPVRLFSVHSADRGLGPENESLVSLELRYHMGDTRIRPLRVDFGSNLGPSGRGWRAANMELNEEKARFGLFQVAPDQKEVSVERLSQVPYFLGEENYFGIDLRFPVLDLDVDLEKLLVSRINLRIYKPFLRFSFKSKMANRKFMAGINDQIEGLKEKLIDDGGVSILNKLFASRTVKDQTQGRKNCESTLRGR